MKNKALVAAGWLLAACAGPAAMHGADDADRSADVRAVSETVDSFDAALRAGDFDRLSSLLDPDVLVLEAGGAERSRDEYLSEHAGADAEFLRRVTDSQRALAVRIMADAALATSTSELRFDRDGTPAVVSTAQTMVLRRTPDGWKIVHIHWSSRDKAPGEAH